jgi:hypothetical protein
MMLFDHDPEVSGEWECMECGYIEEGNEDQRPAKCPECNASASAFEFFSFEEEEEWEEEEDLESDFDEDFDDER